MSTTIINSVNANTTEATYTFTINLLNVSLDTDDEIIIEFKLYGDPALTYSSDPSLINNYTASFHTNEDELRILSTTPEIGYRQAFCPFFDEDEMNNTFGNNNKREIIFSPGLSGFHDNGFKFEPTPLSGSNNSPLFSTYGPVDYDFIISPYDIILIYLEDGTYVEYRVIQVRKGDDKLVRVTIDKDMSEVVKNNLANELYRRFLVLKRVPDETNIYIIYQKNPGQTSYGFVIPNDLDDDILKNIDTITKEVQQKLLAAEQGNTSEG
jgi:hypothetical protein